MRRIVLVMLLVLSGLAVGLAQQTAEQKASPLAGVWQGSVTADVGEMRLRVTLTEKDGKISGTIENAHGTWTIKSATLAAGVWTLPFETEEGASGVMKGKVNHDEFNGDWDFHPMAVGKFALKRTK